MKKKKSNYVFRCPVCNKGYKTHKEYMICSASHVKYGKKLTKKQLEERKEMQKDMNRLSEFFN